MIPYSSIIGFFPYDILDRSPEFRHLFHARRVQNLILGEWEEPRTIVLTDRVLFLSAISSKTLYHRTRG